MMASMGPSFSPHPGAMQQHPGAPPGHPMAHAMAHNPSQPGAQPGGIPHQLVGHMGVSAAGGQMNPAALMGAMPPGAGGPNAHAMQHLSPAQAQMFAAQQQHMNPMFANNPALMQQHRQLQLQQQQQARQALIAQAQAGMYGNVNGIPMGMPMNQMTQQQAAQLAAMRGMRPAQGQNPQAQLLAQQLALQQQQQAQHNQMAHANNPNQPGQLNQQQLQGLQQAQLAQAMQQQAAAAAAAQQHAQAQAQAQQAQQGQPQHPSQQPGPPQQQTPQPQPGQPAPNAAVGPQNPGQQPQGPAPQQPNQGQPPQQQPPTPQQNPVQQAQIAQAHQQAASMMQQQQQQHQQQQLQQKREGLKGQCLLKLMLFAEHLSGFPGAKGNDDLSYWNDFVQRFFSPRGIFRHAIHVIDSEEQTDKQYEITYPALARYFNTHFESGVKNIQLQMDKGTSDRSLPGDCHFIENNKASLVYWFEGGAHLVASGTLRAQFDADQRIELFEFLTTSHDEYISRRMVINAAKPAHNWVKEWHKVNTPDNKQSPEMSKKGKARPMKSPPNPPPDLDLPQSIVKGGLGITAAVHQFLEIVEIVGQMNPLFGFYHAHPGMAPYMALDQYVSQINATPQMANGQPMPMQPGAPRTPSFGGPFPMGASPAQAHQMLPGSPHMGSPAPGHMQAPGMAMQVSQQGTSSSGPSANTSPASNKRRRASTVKNEEDTPGGAPTPAAAGTPQVNGIPAKTKPPTPRMQKRAKGNS